MWKNYSSNAFYPQGEWMNHAQSIHLPHMMLMMSETQEGRF